MANIANKDISYNDKVKNSKASAAPDWLSDPILWGAVGLPFMGAVTGAFDGYKFNNAFRLPGFTNDDFTKLVGYYLTYGEMPNKEQIIKITGNDRLFNVNGDNRYDLLEKDVATYLKKNNLTEDEVKSATAANRAAKEQGFEVVLDKDAGTFTYKDPKGNVVNANQSEDGTYTFTTPKVDESGTVVYEEAQGDSEIEGILLPNGSTVYLPTDSAHSDDYKFNNLLRHNITQEMVTYAINYYITTGGKYISEAELSAKFPDAKINERITDLVNDDVKTFQTKNTNQLTPEQLAAQQEAYNQYMNNHNGEVIDPTSSNTRDEMGYVQPNGTSIVVNDTNDNNNSVNDTNGNNSVNDDVVSPSYTENAFNQYYKDTWSLGPGTTGYSIYTNLANAERNAAQSAMALADAQYQNAAMQQAATVKSITDQVRAERMAKLRAGMNEAQIANQDMQMMMSNINALNDQMNAMNYNTLQAQQQYNLAQDTAYKEYLNNAQAMNQSGAAYYAAQSGDAAYYANWLKNNPGMTLYYDKATGQYKTTTETK